ncbi:hypothetical protein P153DRAFT_371047 [Dothidotthia symphoricarpi CBS 119687]|uniref:EamA domain-containing protein n=1 Tax=Dothidotthia symphoricarpi CBS 119687 TaxID=1392245 RepID=A0A6A5ZXA8_9PLEO|nr:uncharacterized protein P153DRAFT_371047 [Dothidotthia symphoricarpi CBS 119687]KAF2124169.1 hypothetical protein P153DRAFT_371047 [Dothidotthia symphoricarpi CBS 119687]
MAYGTTNPARFAAQDPPAPDTDQERENDAAQARSRIPKSLRDFYERNFGLFLVFLAQTCGSVMNTAAKLLATGYETKFHALHIIFIRMSCTTVLGTLYMCYHRVPNFPFGQKGIRGLLVLRGLAGFFGIFGLYYSLSWLLFSDATVITFIIPTMTALVCFVWLREPFTSREALAGLLAFTGVLFVARPPWLFPAQHKDLVQDVLSTDMLMSVISNVAKDTLPTVPVSSSQRSLAIILAVLGTFGASTAYATIRVIGTRAHSLISVNYFACIATIGSACIILVHPDLHFMMPENLSQWGLIAIIGFSGFLLQFLLTEGLQREKAGRATNLTYLQLVFALIIERVIWGTTPPVESLFGAVLIIGAAIWISLQKKSVTAEQKKAKVVDEESSLLGEGEREAAESLVARQ